MLNLMPEVDKIYSDFGESEQGENIATAELSCLMEKDQKSILLVDDQVGYLELMCEAIAEVDKELTISTAKNGEEAWAKLVNQNTSSQGINNKEKLICPSLIITDLNLPKLSGLELLNRIKSSEHLKAIPVIVLSTSQMESDIASCYQAQVNCFITKPDNIDDFFQVIQNILDFWLNLASLPPTRLN
jgi:CheY-like chemotaxis protein